MYVYFCTESFLGPSILTPPSTTPFSAAVPNRTAYKAWVSQFTERGFDQPIQHTSSPIVWSEEASADDDDNDDAMKVDNSKHENNDGDENDGGEEVIHFPKRRRAFLGGCDKTLEWLKEQVAPRHQLPNLATAAELAIDSEVRG